MEKNNKPTTTITNNESNSSSQAQKLDLQDDSQPISKFEELGLKEDLLSGIYAYGWEKPTHIQQKAIRPLIRGRNTYCQAQAGNGKSGVFVTGALQLVDDTSPNVQAIVIAPVLELAQQTYNVFLNIGKYLKTNVRLSVGGTKLQDERRAYAGEGSAPPVHIVVGTPGRIIDLLKKNYINASYVRMLILDEADTLLDQGFEETISEIFQKVPQDVQVGLFSATMPQKMLEIAKNFMDNAVQILVPDEKLAPEQVRQYFVRFDEDSQKAEILIDLLKVLDINLCIIYLNSIQRVEDLGVFLQKHGIDALKIHGKMEKEERANVVKVFREGKKTRYLLASDLLARGIDVPQVNVVFNFDITPSKETYIHRMGRAGRNNSFGVTVNFVTPRDAKLLCDIESYYSTRIDELPVDVAQIYQGQQEPPKIPAAASNY